MADTIDLNLVETFIRVCDAQSFTQAARALRLPVSSISRAVGRLESQLGAKLLERSTRRTLLTPLGRAYLESARRGLAALNEGRERLGELQEEPQGEIRLTIASDIDHGFFALQIAAFARAHPKIRLQLTVTNRPLDLLAEGFDLAVRVAMRLADSSLLSRRLGEYHAELMASRGYLKTHGAPRRVADLTRHACVLGRAANGTARWTLRGPNGTESVDVRGTIGADDMNFMRQLVLADAGIGLIPVAPGSVPERDSRLVRVLPRYVMPGPSLYLLMPPSHPLPTRVTLLRDHLVRAYAAR